MFAALVMGNANAKAAANNMVAGGVGVRANQGGSG